MNYIKLFEELKRETYLSAADKLRKKGHAERAKVLYDKSYQLIDRLDPNKYTIIGSDPFQIVDIVDINNPTYPVYSAVDSEIILQSRNKKVSIICGYDDCDCEVDDEDGEVFACEDAILRLWMRDMNSDDDYQVFRFKNRKDAFNFRKFLIDHFPNTDLESLVINDIYV